MHKIKPCFDLEGEIFGNWKVLQQVPCPEHFVSHKTQAHWLCVCSCGHKSIVRGETLRSGRSKSCGCATLNQSRDSN